MIGSYDMEEMSASTLIQTLKTNTVMKTVYDMFYS